MSLKSKRPYKSASIIPYHYTGQEYLYLLCYEKDGRWCGSLGGHMDPSDRGNPWTNACRELGEELYDLDGDKLRKYIKKIKRKALIKRISFPYPKKRHYDYLCQWKKIAQPSQTTPQEIIQNFQPNIEIQSVHWVRAEDLWGAMERFQSGPIYGPKGQQIWVPTYEDPKLKKVRLRPCFLDSCLQMYKKGIHLSHIKK